MTLNMYTLFCVCHHHSSLGYHFTKLKLNIFDTRSPFSIPTLVLFYFVSMKLASLVFHVCGISQDVS